MQTLTSDLSSDFAHRTFIPFAATFGDAFLQGRVMGVDTERQAVLLEGGHVSMRTRPHFLLLRAGGVESNSKHPGYAEH